MCNGCDALACAVIDSPLTCNGCDVRTSPLQIPEAVQGALKAVVLDSSHTRAKALICKLLSSEAGLQEVYKQVR